MSSGDVISIDELREKNAVFRISGRSPIDMDAFLIVPLAYFMQDGEVRSFYMDRDYNWVEYNGYEILKNPITLTGPSLFNDPNMDHIDYIVNTITENIIGHVSTHVEAIKTKP